MAYIGNTVENQGFTPAIDYFNGDGVTVTFTLSRPIASVAQVIVAIDNVIQNPSSSYTVAGSAITFSSAPLSGTNNIWVEYTSLITTYNAISQDPTVIGDIRATGGYLAEGDFGNSFVEGVIFDYVTGLGRVTVGTAEGIALYNGGTASRTALASWNSSGTLTNTGGAVIQGLTVGKGTGAIATNTAVGASALNANTTGNLNTAVGYLAGSTNTTGIYNTTVGGQALQLNTTASQNTAVGFASVYSNTTGASNSGLGFQSLLLNTTGSFNTAIGDNALRSNTTASNNTAVGYQSLYSNTTGAGNVAIGEGSQYTSTTASFNVSVGYRTLRVNTGEYNTALGYQALNNSTANSNTAVGYQAGYSNTTGPENTFLAKGAGYSTTTGSSNLFVGYHAGYYNTTGNYNTYVGHAAGPVTTASATGSQNTAIGQSALAANTTANQNTAVGYTALTANTTGTQSCALGVGAGAANTTGSGNIFIGIDSGNATIGHTTGSYNTFIGRCNGSSVSATNQLVITASNSVIAGKGDSTGFISPSGGGVYQGNNSSSWSTTSDRRLKKNIVDNTIGLSAINAIQVRNFEYRTKDEVTELEPQNAIEIAGVQIGAIAQEIQAILPECVKTESTGVMSVDTTNLTWYLINAVKELNAKLEAQALEIATLKAAK